MNQVETEDAVDIAHSLGLQLGSKKGRFRASDLSPTSMVSAAVIGEGFGRPRLTGVIQLVLGILALRFGLGAAQNGRLFFVIVGVAPALLLGGAWLALTSSPAAGPRGERAATWGRIGVGAALVLGALTGLALLLSVIGRSLAVTSHG